MRLNLLRAFGICVSAVLLSSQLSFADRLGNMASPVTNPVNFEDPRINTEARLIYMNHELDSDFITGGGDIQVYALQLRAALTDSLAFIATKDGYIDFNPDGVLEDENGFANVTPGFKYAFLQDGDAGQIGTVGLRYEIPLGSDEVFQGEGDGFVNPFVSGAVALCETTSLIAASGLRIPVDGKDSTFWDLDVHVDKAFETQLGTLYPSLSVNMVHVLDAGRRLDMADEGLDLISFGSTQSEGKTMVVGGVGTRLRMSEKADWGIAYQFPLTTGRGSNVTDWRVTSDLIFSFDFA